jgi:hypothetical protein
MPWVGSTKKDSRELGDEIFARVCADDVVGGSQWQTLERRLLGPRRRPVPKHR